MHQGNWTCSSCGKAITELPFEPRSTEGLLCRDCHAKGKGNGGGSAAPQGERKMYQGNWTCKNCGNAITSLPFEPRDTANLVCIDCYKKSKAG
jgi:CxxC-x17-CxxC domain-containing protein